MEGRATPHHSREFPCRIISNCSCTIPAETSGAAHAMIVIARPRSSLQRSDRHCKAAIVIATQRSSLRRSDRHCNAAIVIATQAAVTNCGEAGQRRRRPTTCKSLVEVVGILFQGQ
jgi:hypothetical protein